MKKILFSTCLLCSAAFAVDISNLGRCVDDVKSALATQQPVMLFTTDYNHLMDQLMSANVQGSFPEAYRSGMLNPFIMYLERLGDWGFSTIFSQPSGNPQTAFLQQIIPDIAEAFLQNGTRFAEKATNAFQEVISDLYDGFLSEEARVSKQTGVPIKPPDLGVLPPIVKWGNPDAGPYTWPVDATSELNLHAAVVSLPPAHATGGLLAWTALPHEVGGHDILHADSGLLQELGTNVYTAVLSGVGDAFLADYWRQCIDETASDVLGLLNTGPTTGIGLVGYFRGLMGGPLRSVGALPPADTHPVDILRGYLAARVVSQFSFAGAKEWSDAIRAEVQKDLRTIYLVDPRTNRYYRLSQQNAIRSAEIVADVIMNTKLRALEGHSLKEIQDWTNDDQSKVDSLALLLRSGSDLTPEWKNSGYYAAHVVAAAVQEALKANANVRVLFDRMVAFLDVMHQYNVEWNPMMTSPPPQTSCACTCRCPCCLNCQKTGKKLVRLAVSKIPKAMTLEESLAQ